MNPEVCIRNANEEDIINISELHNLLVINATAKPKLGFFLTRVDPENIHAQINNPESKCLVATKSNTLLAYLIAKKNFDSGNLVWIKHQAKLAIQHRNHWHIDNIATNPSFIRNGYAKALYSAFVNLSHTSSLSTFVATKPFENKASLAFHYKMGFEEVAYYATPMFHKLPNYRSSLLLKPTHHQICH